MEFEYRNLEGRLHSNPEQKIKDQLKQVEADKEAVERVRQLGQIFGLTMVNLMSMQDKLDVKKTALEEKLEALKKPTIDEAVEAFRVLEAYFGAK